MKEITIDDVIKRSRGLSRTELGLVKKAFEFANRAHKGQKRKTGEAYMFHPLYTAYYIAGLGLGRDTICAALLHDVIEDCDVSESTLKKEFTPTITKLVQGVTNLRHTGDKRLTRSSVENLRRFFIVAARDIRAVIIKLADRLHNAQTIHGLSKERQQTYAQEIKYIYATLSDYLGIQFFKRQFDDIAFKILKPDEYNKIEGYLERQHRKRKRYVDKIVGKIKKLLAKNKVRAEIYGREKSIYSIFKKLQRYLREGKIHSKSEYGRVYDHFGFRILVHTKEDCYKVLGIIHSTWHPLTSEFEDYIANPKPNGYKSLHTTVFCENNKLAEIQIRTFKMHEYDEFGPASHLAYKLSGKRNALPTIAFNWLRKINIFGRGVEKISEKDFKVQVFKDNIFVLTPLNEVKQLPKGSTPIDFAYSVHTEIGNRCRGAKVNGKMVSLDYELHTGDQVEILADKNSKYPVPGWLEFVVSPQTRARIKHVLREKEEKEAIQKGLLKVNTRLKKCHTTFKELLKSRGADIDILIYQNNAQDKNGLLARIGFDLLSVDKIITALYPKVKEKGRIRAKKEDISIEGSTGTIYSKSSCCKPKVSDKIIALMTITRGIRIHKARCPYVKNFDKDRILKAEWV